jgi:uncharacterized protein (UPF0371 family)
MAGFCISDSDAVCDAAKQEVLRRYFKALCSQRQGFSTEEEVAKIESIMSQLRITPCDRSVVSAAVKRAEETGAPAVALQLSDGRMITGKTSSLLGASASLLLNALKALAGIDHDVDVISPTVIEPIQELKTSYMGNRNPRLHTDEILIALSISAATNQVAALAMEQLPKLRGCDAHATVILSRVDENVFSKLGVNITYEAKYQTKKLYHG